MTSETNSYAPTYLLAWHGIGLSPTSFNKVAHAAGVIEKAWRASSKPGREPKSFWRVGESGHEYAIEIKNELAPEPTVRYLEDRFETLLEYLRPWLDAMLSEGEIKLRWPMSECADRASVYRAEWNEKQRGREQAGEAF